MVNRLFARPLALGLLLLVVPATGGANSGGGTAVVSTHRITTNEGGFPSGWLGNGDLFGSDCSVDNDQGGEASCTGADLSADGLTITVNTSGEGTVTRDPDLEIYPLGAEVVITATPAPGWAGCSPLPAG